MGKGYIGSQQQWDDSVNDYYDEIEQIERDMQKQYEKDMNIQIEQDFYNRQPNEI